MTNYRPISLLSSFSKINERATYIRIYDFLESNQNLDCKQYGFRKNHSTIDATAELTQKTKIQNNTLQLYSLTFKKLSIHWTLTSFSSSWNVTESEVHVINGSIAISQIDYKEYKLVRHIQSGKK